MPQIVPAILEETSEAFLDKVSRVTKLPGVKRVQVDFGDGAFIDRKLLPVTAMDGLNPAFEWEAHLMIKEPKEMFDYKMAGFGTVLVHYESFDNSRDLHEAIAAITAEGIKPGVAINPGTPVEVLKDLEKIVHHFQIMGVVPGYQGQEFIPETLERVAALRKLIPNAIIEVDGGINIGNVKKVAHASADLIVVGSALIRAPDMADAWEKLNQQLTISAEGGSASGGNN